MKENLKIKLPAHCAMLTEEEQAHITGGGAAGTAVRVVIALGISAVLLGVAATAARGVLGVFGGDVAEAGRNWIKGSLRAGQNFVNQAVNAGSDLLSSMMGR